MNVLPKAWRKLKEDPHVTELKGRHHRLSHQSGLMELSFNLSPAQRDEFEAKAKALKERRESTINAATRTCEDLVERARIEASNATDKAHDDYEASVFALFMEYGKLPSREQIAIDETEVGHVVQAPKGEPELQLTGAVRA